MNTRRIQGLILISCAIAASRVPAEVGEFIISDRVLRELQIVSTETTPFTKKGRKVTPNLNIRLTPAFANSENDISLKLNVDLEGTSHSTGNTPVFGGKSVTSSVVADVKAHYEQDLKFNGKSLEAGKFVGKPEIKPKSINVTNNFGLLNRMVNKKAKAQAPGQVHSQLPQERAELDQKLRAEVQGGIDTAKKYIEETASEVQKVLTQANQLPFQPQFSSKAGENGAITLKLNDSNADSKPRAPKPVFTNQDQIATSGVFHQDVLSKTISQEIAGKEMKIAELKAYLCSEKIASLINFCEAETPDSSLGLSVIFDEKNPLEVSFNDSKVTLKINARNRVGITADNKVSSGLFSDPSKTNNQALDSDPYQVEISYALKGATAHLEQVQVRDFAPETLNLSKANGNHGQGSWTDAWNRLSRVSSSLMTTATKKAIENEYRRIMKDKLDFPNISIPTKLKRKTKDLNEKPEILEAGSLIPLEVKAQDGWLAISSAFCTEKMRPLGISFDKKNRISEVQKGSPADLAGIKVGDRIDSFGDSTEGRSSLIRDINPFLEFVKEKSIGKTSDQRTIELSGVNSAGVSFKKSISLCPSQINHRKEAEKVFELKKAK
jgi:hypothetical protein